MKAKIEIGTRINKGGIEGTITKIITKSTGYVEVTFDNGKVKKEMAFNINTTDGDQLKATPVRKPTSQAVLDRNHAELCSKIRDAHDAEYGYVTGHSMEYIIKSSIL